MRNSANAIKGSPRNHKDTNMRYISADPIFDNLHDDYRFRDLLCRMKLPLGK